MNDIAQETTAVMATLVEHEAGILLVSLLWAVKKESPYKNAPTAFFLDRSFLYFLI